jgi:hypothetical protein
MPPEAFPMTFNPRALWLLLGFVIFIAVAASPASGNLKYLAEALVTVAILIGVSGLARVSR